MQEIIVFWRAQGAIPVITGNDVTPGHLFAASKVLSNWAELRHYQWDNGELEELTSGPGVSIGNGIVIEPEWHTLAVQFDEGFVEVITSLATPPNVIEAFEASMWLEMMARNAVGTVMMQQQAQQSQASGAKSIAIASAADLAGLTKPQDLR